MIKTCVNKYIITGGPGFGKTTIINSLSELGFMVVPEAARHVIENRSVTPHDLHSNTSRYVFDKYIMQMMVEQYSQCINSKPTFFDRGIPDLIAWRKYFNMNCDDVMELAYQYKYEKIVFISKPWIDIYLRDIKRPFSFDDSNKINTIISDVYSDLGYSLEYLPNDTNENRVEFILNKLGLQK